MTTAIWTNSMGDGLVTTGGNWSGGSGAGGIPGAGQSLLFNYGLPGAHDVIGGNLGIAVADITVTPGFRASIGSDGNPLVCTNITGTLTYAGNGPAARFAPSGTVAAAVLGHSLGVVYLSGAGTWTSIINTNGRLDIAASTIVTTLENVGGVCTVGYCTTAITSCLNGGTLTILRNITTLNCERGITIQQDAGTATPCKVGTAANVRNGATYNKQSSDTDPLVTAYPGGRFTLEGNTGGASAAVAITSVVAYIGSTVLTQAVPGVTVTAPITYKGAATVSIGVK